MRAMNPIPLSSLFVLFLVNDTFYVMCIGHKIALTFVELHKELKELSRVSEESTKGTAFVTVAANTSYKSQLQNI
jgi:hypothetical protein